MNITTKPTLCLIKELPAAIGAINTVAISSDNNWIASAGSGSRDRYNDIYWSLQLYDRSWEKFDLAKLNKWAIHGRDITSVRFSPDAKKLIVGGLPAHQKLSLSCWNVEHASPEYSIDNNQSIGTIIENIDNKTFFVIDSSGIIKEYAIETGIIVKEKLIDKGASRWDVALVISSDGKHIYIGGHGSSSIEHWLTKSGEDIKINFQTNQGGIQSLALSSDDRILASGSDQRIRIWNAQTGELLHSFYGHADWVRGLAITPDSRFLISAGDEKIKFWDLATGKKLNTIIAHDKPIRSIALSRDGSTLVSGSTDGIVKVWQVNEISEIVGL
jgi:COMPASS component SWD3